LTRLLVERFLFLVVPLLPMSGEEEEDDFLGIARLAQHNI